MVYKPGDTGAQSAIFFMAEYYIFNLYYQEVLCVKTTINRRHSDPLFCLYKCLRDQLEHITLHQGPACPGIADDLHTSKYAFAGRTAFLISIGYKIDFI